MKDIKGFIKLFDLNIPNIEHFDYYIDQLSKIQKFKNIKELITLYEKAESELDVDIYDYRLKKSQEVIEFIKNSNAYSEMMLDNQLIDYPTSRSANYEEGVNYFSIDMKSANWVSLKRYDPPHINELGTTYSDLLSIFEMPEIFIHSKYLRQFIFGNINPKRISKVQRNMIQDVVRKYQDNLQIDVVRADEVIFSFKEFSEIKEIYNSIDKDKFNVKIFNINRVEDFRIDSVYDIDGNFLYKDIFGVDGTQLFIKIKEYLTHEDIDVRDLYFRNNGKLAIWNYDGFKIEKV